MNKKVEIYELNPSNFEFQNYVEADSQLIAIDGLDTKFVEETDYIESYIFDENKFKIYPTSGVVPLSTYKVIKSDIIINPEEDLVQLGFDQNIYYILYNVFRKRLYSSPTTKYFIKEISSDRTEIRLDSNTIENNILVSSTNNFIEYRKNAEYFVDFYLNFGDNKTVIANNLKLDTEIINDPTILIKLYEPLPIEFNVKDELWVVEEISEPLLYQVKFPVNIEVEDNFTFLQGPNFNLEIKNEKSNSSQLFSLDNLLNTNITSSTRQVKSLLEKNEINININYEKFSEFINFSSAKTRLENFYYKAGLIESYNNSISTTLGNITGNSSKTQEYSASVATYESLIDNITNNFDDYEYFLYYNSGSKFSYPKSNLTPPYNLYSTGSTEVLEWLGSADPNNDFYGGIALSASNFDDENSNNLYFSIPEYLRDDPENEKYELFVNMVSQYYDNIWVYTKDVTRKFDSDNRLEYGISKDLIDIAIKDFGVKLYSNNFDNDDLYTAFLGLTPSGSLFPFPNITGSISDQINTPSGYEYVDTKISSSNDVIPTNDINKRLYKRIYHNLPYLLKTKGTIPGLKALITSYGIPDTILRINEFGGKNRNESQDWDLEQNVFNYAFDTEGKYIMSSSFDPNPNFGGQASPRTVQLRFKSNGIPTGSWGSNLSQSLFHLPFNRSALVLEYTGSGFESGSYSGSIPNLKNQYGVLKYIPDFASSPNISASLYLPFFDGGWWSIQTTTTTLGTASLFAANIINNELGFTGSDSIVGFDPNYYFQTNEIYFPTDGTPLSLGTSQYSLFSGSYQEIRYYNSNIPLNAFYDYTMNPYSYEGTTNELTDNELLFRAPLGTTLDTSSRSSIHPKITGSSNYVTQSFSLNSNFYLSASNFINNKEIIHQDQVAVGIKNRVNNKISINNNITPEGNTLSPFISIQQESHDSSSYNPTANYLEVAFSPQDQINDDINAQMGHFNIGEYIGDPRHISESTRNYPDLDMLRNTYFQKYMASYNLIDFVRLIKFFDNSLFKMIKDFVPARTSLSSGVIIKQHILERNRVKPAQIFPENVTYSGSIKPQVRNYNTGSGDVGQYEYTSGSSLYRFSGGTGGSFERFNGLNTSPSSSNYNLSNKFHLTQSFTESKEGKLGREIVTVYNQEEFYDGEFSGSNITVTTQSLGPECIIYLKNPDKPLNFYPLFFADGVNLEGQLNMENGTVLGVDFLDGRNAPLDGYAWIYNKITSNNPPTLEDKYNVFNMKISGVDANGNEVRDFIQGAEVVQFVFPEGIKTYKVDGVVIFDTHAALTINREEGDYRFASSSNGGTENWSLQAYGTYRSSTGNVAGFDPFSQGKYHALSDFQDQVFRYYDQGGDPYTPSVVGDPLNLFDTGSLNFESTPIFGNMEGFKMGTYLTPRTSNVPWVISCSIFYSASFGGTAQATTAADTLGIFHTGSFYNFNSIDQTIYLKNNEGVNAGDSQLNSIMISSVGYDTSTDAINNGVLDTIIYFTGSDGSTSSNPLFKGNGGITNIFYTKRNNSGEFTPSNYIKSTIPINNKFHKIGNSHAGRLSVTQGISKFISTAPSSEIGATEGVIAFAGREDSFALSPYSVTLIQNSLDSTYFSSSFSRITKGDDFRPNRYSYVYNSDTNLNSNNDGEIKFNNANPALATQILLSQTASNGKIPFFPTDDLPDEIYVEGTVFGRDVIDAEDLNTNTVNSSRIIFNANTDGTNTTLRGTFNNGDNVKIYTNATDPYNVAGHPLISVPGTASLSFDYSELPVGGVEPVLIDSDPSPLGPLSDGILAFNSFQPLDETYATNDNFTVTNGPEVGAFNSIEGGVDATDGNYYLDLEEVQTRLINEVAGGNISYGAIWTNLNVLLRVTIVIEYTSDGSQSTDSVLLGLGQSGDGVGGLAGGIDGDFNVTLPTVSSQGTTGTLTLARDIPLVQNSNTIYSLAGELSLRPEIGYNGENASTFIYRMERFRVQVIASGNYNPNDTSNNYGYDPSTQANTTSFSNRTLSDGIERHVRSSAVTSKTQLLDFLGSGNNSGRAGYFEAVVQPNLFITGSHHHPKQLIIAGPGLPQIPTGSAVLSWETGSINNIYRTSSVSFDEHIINYNTYTSFGENKQNALKISYIDANFLGNGVDPSTIPSSSFGLTQKSARQDVRIAIVPTSQSTSPTRDFLYPYMRSTYGASLNSNPNSNRDVIAESPLTSILSPLTLADRNILKNQTTQTELDNTSLSQALNDAELTNGWFKVRYIDPTSTSNPPTYNTVVILVNETNNYITSFYEHVYDIAIPNFSTVSTTSKTLYPTINTSMSMYYPEYSFSYGSSKALVSSNNLEVLPTNNSIYPKLQITNSISIPDLGYKFTGSLKIHKGDADDLSTLGPVVFQENFIVPNSESVDVVTVSGSIGLPPNTFKYNDTFRMSLSANKGSTSFLDITEYTMSLFPSESAFATITEDLALYGVAPQPDGADYGLDLYGGSINTSGPGYNKFGKPKLTEVILSSYYGQGVLPFAIMLDCQPLLNNYNLQRPSQYLMDVDYSNITGSLIPVNFDQILNNIATRATVPDSNYTQESFILPRYKGTKTTSINYNKWSPRDRGTFGEFPVIELRTAFFGYFNSINDLYPLLNDAIGLNVTYFIDQQGNAIPPTLSSGFGKSIVEKAYSRGDEVTISFNTSSVELDSMNSNTRVLRVGTIPYPVLYTQNSGRTYARDIYVEGEGRLSLYDNNDSNSFTTFTTVAEGTSSYANDNVNNIPTPATYTSGAPVFKFQTLNASTTSSQFSGFSEYKTPYPTNTETSGIIKFIEDPNEAAGTPLTNPQTISFETSFATSYLYEGYRKRKNDGDELKVQVKMEVSTDEGSTFVGVPFELEDIEMIIHKTSGNPINIGSIIGRGKGGDGFELCVFSGQKLIAGKSKTQSKRQDAQWTTSKVWNEPFESYFWSVENPAYNAFISKKGVYTRGSGDVQFRGDMTATEWKISGNSGDYIFNNKDQVRFKVGIAMLQSVDRSGNNVIFPQAYTGPIFPTKVNIIGAKDANLANANTGSAPFWVYTGSAGVQNTSILDRSILVMSSSIINEAYGNSYTQETLLYTPGSSSYFPSGVEPQETTIGPTKSPIYLLPEDEIRFQNSELYTYKILKVDSPSENIEDSNGSPVGRIKIYLDRPVDPAINKDFFLIRRNQESANSFIVSGQYPYNSQNSGSQATGVVYPEYPAVELEISSSKIITDLVSKGIIT